jgi:superfamily I DNA/RNA helicase
MDTLKNPMYSIKQPEPINPDDHPQLFHFPTKDDQQNRLFSEINQLIQRGYEASDILIINADIQSTRFLAQEIRDALRIRTTALTGSMIIEDNTLKLCDIQSATGLQSKIVFITGLENIFDAEQSVELSDRERHSLQTDNTRLMHMAMTRASDRLYLMISTKQVPDSLIIEGLDTPTLSKEFLAPVRYLNP